MLPASADSPNLSANQLLQLMAESGQLVRPRRQRPVAEHPRERAPERYGRNRLRRLIPDQEGSVRHVFSAQDTMRNKVLCTSGGLGEGCIQIGKVLTFRVFADLTPVQHIEKEAWHSCSVP